MSFGATKLLAASGGEDAYSIDQSLMFEVADSSYLSKTPSSASNQRTWTLSTWIKNTSENYGGAGIWTSWDSSTQSDASYGWLGLYQDKLQMGGWSTTWRTTNRLFRDVGAWMHLVVAVDTTIADGSADNRIRIYINGVEETSFATKNNPSQNYDLPWNSTQQHRLGAINGSTAYYLGGYLAETQVIDGSQLTPSSFGETDAATGQWIPKEPSGLTYGTNGFYLPFKKNDRYSVYFDGSSSTGIQIADSTDFAVGSGSFTYECWAYGNEDQGVYRELFGQADSSGSQASIGISVQINTSNQPVSMLFYNDGAPNAHIVMTSSTAMADNKWNHIAFVRNGTSFVLYLNGTSVATATSSESANDGVDCKFGIGRLGESASNTFKGWISNFRFVKGTAVYTGNFTPSTSPLTAITNTKLLCCQDSTATTDNSGTSKTLTLTAANTYTQQIAPFQFDWYQDQSGQDNDYQPDNITINDLMLDTPTNNFPTLNSLANTMGALTQGNLKIVSANNSDACYSTIGVTSGKWYWEVGVTDIISGGGHFIGVGNAPDVIAGAAWYSAGVLGILTHNGNKINNGWGTTAAYVGAASDGDIISVALDMDNGKMWVARNGTWGNSGDPAAGSNSFVDGTYALPSGHVMPIIGRGGSYNETYIFNFGQNGTFNGTETAQGNADGGGIGNFYYAPPSGFKALCASNFATPAIKKSTDHFNPVLYTGNGSTQSITGVGHQPDLVWLKNRSASDNHKLTDAVRGVTKELESNTTDAEATNADGLTAFGSDGFSLGDDDEYNTNTENYVSWNWKAGGSGSANNSGDIDATVSVNTTAGFSIVKWTANGSDKDTIAHGLGVQPAVVIYKTLDTVVNWYLMTDKIDGTDDYLYLNTSAAKQDNNTGTYGWQTSSTITNWLFGSTEMIAYCFAEVEGFSKFGSFFGNGEAEDGPYVYTGFSPALVIVKEASSAGGSWFMWDNKREVGNVKDAVVWADTTNAETSHAEYEIDVLSNGFKIRGNSAATNQSGQTMLYLCWAESPFKYATAR